MTQPQSGAQEAAVIRPQAQDQAVQVSPDAPGFRADTPASVPAFEIPDLALDAIGLPADVMAQQVPTLGEAIGPTEAGSPTVLHAPHDGPAASPASALLAVGADAVADAPAQAPSDAADTWVAQMQMRIDRLADDVRALNDRLDRFVKHTKV